MNYRIELSPAASRQFKKLDTVIQKKLKPKITALAGNPRPRGVKKLEGAEELYRLRIGDYRIIYQIQDDRLIILIVKIGDRKEIYRR